MDNKIKEKDGDNTKELESRCCQSGCPGCPWGFVADPETPGELINNALAKDGEVDWQELAEKYLSQESTNSPESGASSK